MKRDLTVLGSSLLTLLPVTSALFLTPVLAADQPKPVDQKVSQPKSAQKTPAPPPLKDANFKGMQAGYCLAASKIKDTKAPGGFAKLGNIPKPIETMKVEQDTVYLQANPAESTTYDRQFKGMKLRLINTTKEQIAFRAQDSRLSIVQEALDEKGKWRPIEYLTSSWCGNSYHSVFLEPNQYWEFSVPRYSGAFKTKLRFRMDEKDKVYLSNEFGGSINKEQYTAPKEQFKQVPKPLAK